MKFAISLLKLTSFAFGQTESEDYSFPADYPEEGQALNIRLQRTRTADLNLGDKMRQISHRRRLINSQISQAKKFYFEFHNYGCYCVAPSDPNKMRGRPVDELDSACKKHSLCYSCAFSDYKCDPKTMGYRYKITSTSSGNQIQCTNDPDSCAYASCMCDKGLAEDLGTLLMNGIQLNSTYREYDGAKCTSDVRIPENNDSGINEEKNRNEGFANSAIDQAVTSSFSTDIPEGVFFDDASTSSFSSNSEQITFLSSDHQKTNHKEKKCCGQYPKRFPYVVGGNHECCKTGFLEHLKPIGTC